MTATTLTVGDIQMAYDICGPKDAPVICLNHCFATDHRFWDLSIAALRDYRVLRYDTRGHGDTDKPPGEYDLMTLATDVRNLLDVLEISQVHFCGVSLGGMIGQTLTLEYSDRVASLTIANTPCEYTDEQRNQWRERASLVRERGIEAVHDGLMNRWFTDNAAANDAPGYVYVSNAIQRFTVDSFSALTSAMCGLNTTARLADINIPVMIIASPDDPGVPQEISHLMCDRIPNAELHWLSPSRHLSTLEHVEAFDQLFLDFLRRVA